MLAVMPAHSQSDWTPQKPVAQQQEEAKREERNARREAKQAAKEAKKAQKEAKKAQKEAKKTKKETVEKPAPARESNRQTSQEPVPSGKDARYLKPGCVPTDADGKVVFTLDLSPRGFSAQEIYASLRSFLDALARDDNQKERIGLVSVNDKERKLVARYDEWLRFTDNFIVSDKAEFRYMIMAECGEERLHLTISRITYAYETDRNGGFKLPARDVITDKNAVNKKHTKLLSTYGKFRRKTIDRVDYVFGQIRNLFNR